MIKKKRIIALVLALVMTLSTVVSAYALQVWVRYKQYVYSSQVTFNQYDYSSSTTPRITQLTVLAESSLGSGSALYHVKEVDGEYGYCIQPGAHSDDSSNYRQGSSACWYNLPAAVQSSIALALACGFPEGNYGTASGDRNSSDIIIAEKWAATQCVMQRKHKFAVAVLALAGIALLLWPGIHRRQVQQQATEIADTFLSGEVGKPYQELYAVMEEYNRTLVQGGQVEISDSSAFSVSAIDLSTYGIEDEIIGVVGIPAMDFKMPVYLGAGDTHLAKGLAQLG